MTSTWRQWCGLLGGYFGDIILSAIILVKRPIASLIAISVMAIIVQSLVAQAFEAAQASLKSIPVCDFPFVSSLLPCPVHNNPARFGTSPTRADFPTLLNIQHRALDELAVGSGLDLALNIKHTDLAVRDLIVLVRASNLTARDALADTLAAFSLDARQAARDLQRVTTKIYAAMDSIAAFNTYALRTLEDAQAGHKRRAEREQPLSNAVLRIFHSSLSSFGESVSAIITDATTASVRLELLEQYLTTLHALCLHEAFETALALDELLWQLWTILGGNRQQVRDLKNRASVLKHVQQYRTMASVYVAGTMQTLTRIDAELVQLYERLSSSEKQAELIPLEVQLASIDRSVSRMKEDILRRRTSLHQVQTLDGHA